MSTLQGTSARPARWVGLMAVAVAVLITQGCASLMSSAASGLADNLSAAVLNQNDPETVRDGAPAYLLLLDSFLEGSPEDPALLSAVANLYATYGTVFADDPDRASRLTARARDYSTRALCNSYKPSCNWSGMLFGDYQGTLAGLTDKHADVVFSHGLASLAYIRAHSADYAAIALLPYSEALFERYLEINDGTDDGAIHTYLGILNTLIPPALGGKPEKGREHFERAISLSGGTDLSAKVEYANGYARLLYERELHDRLLTEVLAADPEVPGSTLLNVLAQRQAVELLESADDYF
ncbi:MAG: TRAP transporter TatT component family protein [Proteobacteria bacterium]|nr:TRAP transporter TatT component family protein [Pseudomonadota bacterium]MDA0994019.1 TRAP transporter TatT component family protein [Pseudomonadota bacterium]